MHIVKAAVQYVGAVTIGMIMAFIGTGLISIAIFPPDGPVGEGLIMLFIALLCCCVSVPGYIALMTLHRQGNRSTRGLIACEVILRASVIVGASVVCFIIVKLPTMMSTKLLACAVGLFACAWAIKPTFWERDRRFS